MASFKAENIETDDESDDEHDDTKEIQIEEALKIYQTAVKLQSQGEAYIKETEAAFKTLFESEVFKYPESLSEYSRTELLGDQYDADDLWLTNLPTAALAPAPVVDSAPSTLPQVLHLSYKNRGQLQLDALQAALKSKSDSSDIYTASINALSDFTEALDKDIDDVDLWRKASKVSQSLRSQRISRYCLETILEGDEQGTDETLGDLGMEMKLANVDLKEIIQTLNDDLSRQDAPSGNRESLSYWQKRLALYPQLPEIEERSPSYDTKIIEVASEPTWLSIGSSILERLTAEQDGRTHSIPEAPWRIDIPNLENSTNGFPTPEVNAPEIKTAEESNEMTVDSSEQLPPENDQNPTTDALPTGESGTDQLSLTKTITTEELPIRKRSSEAAELPEEPEGGRIRSKRIRARESMAGDAQHGESTSVNTNTGFDQKIQLSAEADEWLFDTLIAIMGKIGIKEIQPSKTYRDLISPNTAVSTSSDGPGVPYSTAMLDFYGAMQSWSAAKTQKLLMSGKSEDSFEEARRIGLSSYLEYANPKHHKTTIEHFNLNLDQFINTINDSQKCTSEVAFEWVCSLLRSRQPDRLGKSSYMLDAWPSPLKTTLLQILIKLNDLLYARLSALFWEENALATAVGDHPERVEFASRDGFLLDLVQSLFELHLDDYFAIAESAGGGPSEAKLQQRVRLNNWARLAHDAISLYSDQRIELSADIKSDLSVIQRRHLWASVYQLKALGESKREHLVLCIEDLKREVFMADNATVDLPNSTNMPELSFSAAEAEISKLETMDFFLNIFSSESQVPVDLIENLEPLLESSILPETGNAINNEEHSHLDTSGHQEKPNQVQENANKRSRSTFQILAYFIRSAGAQLRLSLWRRLLEAYETIDYPPKMFSIHLRSIQVIMGELDSPTYTDKGKEEREELLLAFVHELSTTLDKAINLIREHSDVLECLDLGHLQASIKAVADLWVLLYSVGLFDDYSQAGGKGGSSVNPFRSYPSGGTFHQASVKLHDMQVQTAVLLYKLIAEVMEQMPETFTSTNDIKLEYLRHMHHQFGVRRICKAFDSFFLHFMKDELLKLPHLEYQSSTDLAQVLYDLYDLYCFPIAADRQSHGCDADYLDRKTAMQLIDFVMDKASRVSVKELLKSDLGKSIEKLHGTLGMVKSNLAASRNRSFYTAYLKTPVQPLELFRCLTGISDLSTVSVSPEEAPIASKGWYFLKGQLSLAKYRSQRAKNAAGDEDDLEDATGFFMQDLELSAERWETWYRMAQAHDCLLEEQILWSSEKLNNEENELSQLQRATIHCYAMATAAANRSADVTKEVLEKLSDLYTDFATCVYSATREPFKMGAFSLKDFQRHTSNDGVVTDASSKTTFSALPRAKAWKFCIALLHRAIAYKPQKWVNHYVLGKCLWKMHTRSDRPKETRVAVQKAFLRAIELLPDRKDPNRQEPILEPIYKFISITYKFVKRKEIDAQQGSEDIEKMLHMQKQIDIAKRPSFSESSSWPIYIIDVLKMLRAADKPRWHHRLVLRAARMMYEYIEEGTGGAKAAKDYLVEQHIYSTKTYALSIWKPDNERPGRHWVYTKQYAMFLALLLDKTDDIEGIQLLAKRVRKKPNDFFEHSLVWEDVFERHVEAHRRYAGIMKDGSDATFRGLDQEEFQKRADLIDTWINSPQNTHRLFEVIRETAELKKLNTGLVKSGTIDDLLADTYAAIWKVMEESGAAAPHPLPTTEAVQENEVEPPAPAPQTESAAETATNSPSKDTHRNVMSLTNLMNLDGASDMRDSQAATPTPSQPDQTVTKTKSRLVSKREIVKRANEATINKAAVKTVSTPPPPAAAPTEPSYSATPKVVIGTKTQQDAVPGEAESAQGSVHDDADDESELSELDVEEEEEDADDEEETSVVVVRPMFPNLRSPSSDTDDRHGSTEIVVEGREVSQQDEDVTMQEEEQPVQGDGMDVD